MSYIRVLIADDHPVVREGLSILLSSLPDIEVVGIATSGREAIDTAAATRPDVALLDLQMPDLDGWAATRELIRVVPGIGVLVLTMFDDDESFFAAVRAGAKGYLLKGAEQEEIARAIRAVASGEAIFGPQVTERVLAQLTADGPRSGRPHPFPELSPREQEILDLLAAGLSNPAIARRLGVAPKTIANNVSSIFAKLQVGDRAEAMVLAREAGLGRRDPSDRA